MIIYLQYDPDQNEAIVHNADSNTLKQLKKAELKGFNPLDPKLPDLTDLSTLAPVDFTHRVAETLDLSPRQIRRIMVNGLTNYPAYVHIEQELAKYLDRENSTRTSAAAWVLYLASRFSETELRNALQNWDPNTTLDSFLMQMNNISEDDLDDLMEYDPDA